jgi:hypothetical protein
MKPPFSWKVTSLFLVVLVLALSNNKPVEGAAVETPSGKRIPGRIVDEKEGGYKIGTDLPGGGRIIFNVDKDKVDPHGTVPGKGRIEDVKGKVEIKKAGYPRFFPANKNTIVNPGDQIRTTAGAEAVVTLENMAVNGLGADTEYTLKSLEVNPETKSVQVSVEIPQGKLWSEVGHLKTEDSNYVVETPAAVTGVRGTVFRVEVEKDTSTTNVSVLSGEVAVNSKGIEAPEMIIGKQQALSVRPGAEPKKLSASQLLQHFLEVIKEWAKQSEYYKTVTALAGIGEVEQIELEPALPQEQKQRVYDEIQAGWEKASEDFYQIDKALKMFYLDFARFPTPQEGLDALIRSTGSPQWNGPYIEPEFLTDHYGESYTYVLSTDAYGNTVAQIVTYGFDKKSDTPDDRLKIVTEEDARRWEDNKSYR